MLRKSRSLILFPASACGSGATGLTCAVISRKSSAASSADSQQSSLSGLKGASKPDGRPIGVIVERNAVGPNIGSRVGPAASGKKNWLPLRRRKAKKELLKLLCLRARVIQTEQKIATRENHRAGDLAVGLTGSSTQERLTKNSVALYAITLCAPRRLELRGTTSRGVVSVRSPLSIACASSWRGPDRVASLEHSSQRSYDVDLHSPSEGTYCNFTGA